jgi:hypothetical protein
MRAKDNTGIGERTPQPPCLQVFPALAPTVARLLARDQRAENRAAHGAADDADAAPAPTDG